MIPFLSSSGWLAVLLVCSSDTVMETSTRESLSPSSLHISVLSDRGQDQAGLLKVACQRGDLETVREIIEEDPELRFKPNPDGFLPIHYASISGRLNVVEYLWIGMTDYDWKQDDHGGHPLQYAASFGHLEIVKFLIKRGAPVDPRDANGRSPLIWAVQKSELDIVQHLLDSGADPNLTNKGKWNSLHYAYRAGIKAIIQQLIDAGADEEAKNALGLIPSQIKPR